MMDALYELGLEEPTAMQLASRLQATRAATYDELEMTRGWSACYQATMDYMATAKSGDKVSDAYKVLYRDNDLQLPSSHRSPARNKEMQTATSTITRLYPIYKAKIAAAVANYDACVGQLAAQSSVGRKLPDTQSVKELLTQALVNLLNLKKKAAENEQIQPFRNMHTAAVDAYSRLRQDWTNPLKTDQEKLSLLNETLQLGATAKELGIAAIDYADKTIDTYDRALAGNLDFTDETRAGFLAGKKKLQDETSKVLSNTFDMRRMELDLFLMPTMHLYDQRLIENHTQAQVAESKMKTIHDFCSDNIAASEPNVGVPDDLLHKVLTTLPAKYEDAAHQLHYLAGQFEKKGQGIENNNTVVEYMKAFANSMQRMQELLDSQLGKVESSDKAGQGTTAEVQKWIQTTLETCLPSQYDSKAEIEDLAEEMEELALQHADPVAQGTSATAAAKATPAVNKGPTPSQQDPVKKLNSLIAAAENTKTDEKTKQELAFWAAESTKHSGNARKGAQEGASPHTVEEDMKLAASNEPHLATKKTQIAKKFQKALARMDDNHEKYQEYKTKVTDLTEQALQHNMNHDALLDEGKTLRIEMSKTLAPTHSLFHYLCDENQIRSVSQPAPRKELDWLDKDGNPRINLRTNEPFKDYMDEYVIELEGGKKFVAHFHYKSMDAAMTDISACHFKTWEQKGKGSQFERKEAKEGRDAELHRGKTNLETLNRLLALLGNNNN
jgi:hypothetical protein